MATTTKNLKGKRFKIQVADGYAVYEVIRVGNYICHVRWVEDPEVNPDGYVAVIGKFGPLSTKKVAEMLACEENMNKSMSDSEEWADSLTPGTIIHYNNGHDQFVRCEVVLGPVDHDEYAGKPCYKPIALVGNWRDYDRKWDSYHVEKIAEGELFRPHASCVWEAPQYAGRSGTDPTGLDPIPLSSKPKILSGTLRVTCGDINVEAPTKYNRSSSRSTVGPVMDNLLTLLREAGGYHAEVHTEDGNINPFMRS